MTLTPATFTPACHRQWQASAGARPSSVQVGAAASREARRSVSIAASVAVASSEEVIRAAAKRPQVNGAPYEQPLT